MRALFNVFSGTGNTHRVCHAILNEWRRAGVECKYVSIMKDCEICDPNSFDRIVIGYPVHAFNAPEPVVKFLKSLPKCSGERLVYFVKTSGEPLRLNDGSCIDIKSILQKKGYTVAGEYHYIMPYNIIFRHSDGMVARMWRAVQIRVPEDAKEMLDGKITELKPGLLKHLWSILFRIERLGMHVIGKAFRASDDCIGCGKCARRCPQRNITIAGSKPVFGKECVGCMRCAFTCPADAVRIGVLDGWRVNGEYSFIGDPAPDTEVCHYCKNAYLRYFKDAEDADNPIPEC